MIKHHPDVNLLVDYVSGNLSPAKAACIAAHNSYCGICRKTTFQLETLGAELFKGLECQSVSSSTFDSVLARLDKPPSSQSTQWESKDESFPLVLKKLMSKEFADLEWRRVTSSLSVSQLDTGDSKHECALYQIAAGGKIPEHDHEGAEMTVVISGGFSDRQGVYHKGDFIFREKDQIHAPTALESEDCICLAVSDAPLRFTGWKYRWMNPFLRFSAG